MSSYFPRRNQARWKAAWEKNDVFKRYANWPKRPKYYVLGTCSPIRRDAFHMGPRAKLLRWAMFTARYKIATGHNVLHRMG